ncbi:hypothetical protein [Paenibacillus kobensis]|uniref:hypothetical protein n=1 Tax=Paenibacillus kobensis TaxID=59841 RepID=UPI000FD6C145|nr:hypothetical protein [Paenibacillus kobensis]
MSTVFEVYPGTSVIPSMTELLQLANRKLHHFLEPHGLQVMPMIHVRLGERFVSPDDTSAETVAWSDEYAWFYAEPSEKGGGTDAYYEQVDETTLEIWDSYSEYGDTYVDVRRSLVNGHYWTFRRSAGQPAIINLAYGLLASALAELTEGYLYSDDGAWYGAPIRPVDFDPLYFYPDKAYSMGKASWFEGCLISILEEYGGTVYEPRYDQLEYNELTPAECLVFHPSGRLLREGPATDDRVFIMLSPYGSVPYLYMDRTLLKASEETLTLEMKLLRVRSSSDIITSPVDKVLDMLREIDYDRPDLTFWTNPLCIKDGEDLKPKLMG